MPHNGGQFEQWLSFVIGYEIGFGDFECPGADFVEREGWVGFDFFGSEQVVVEVVSLFVVLGGDCVCFIIFFGGDTLLGEEGRIQFLFVHYSIIDTNETTLYSNRRRLLRKAEGR